MSKTKAKTNRPEIITTSHRTYNPKLLQTGTLKTIRIIYIYYDITQLAFTIVLQVAHGYWFFGRPTMEDLRQDLRAVTRKCRPDWDITTPDLREAWREGHKERFYPYGKTYAQTIGEQD
jgi:hypothetical protein